MIVIAVLVSAAVVATSGALAGITLFLGFSGVLSLTLLFVPSRPKVIATLRGGENAITGDSNVGMIIGADQTVRPLQIEEIVKEQEHTALETMPRAPTPKVPPGSAFESIFNLNQSAANMFSAVSGATDEELQDFIGEVKEYGEELREWLELLQAARRERLRAFTASARVSEKGQAAADFTRIRLCFPQEFEELEAPPKVPEPPLRPEFTSRQRVALPLAAQRPTRVDLSRLVHDPAEYRGVNAEYSSEEGSTFVSLSVGHLNQSDHRDTAEFALRAPPSGTHEVRWRISADGINPPTEGTIRIEVREPLPTEPIKEMADALTERKHHSLD